MADADPAPAALPEANPPDLASDAELAARAAALVAALRSGDSDAQVKAARDIRLLATGVGYSEPPRPAIPRTTAALVAAGVGAALLPLIDRASEVGISAASALRVFVYHSGAERRAVVDNLGADKLLQLLHESQIKHHRNHLAHILWQLTFCNEWMESLSPDCDLVSRIFSLPFLSTANAFATDRALATAFRLLEHHPSFRRALVPARTSLLAELLKPLKGGEDSISLTETACSLLHMLQKQGDFDALAFDEARVHVSCVQLLGHTLRKGAGMARVPDYVEATRVLAASFDKSAALRKRIHTLIFACPGALSGVVLGVGDACIQVCDDAHKLVAFLDSLRRLTRGSPESFLVDTQFAAYAVIFYASEVRHPAYVRLYRALMAAWKMPDCLRALAQALDHQKLPVAVTLASLCEEAEFRRVLAADDHLEVLAQELVGLACSPRLGTAPVGDFQASREDNLRQSVAWLVASLRLDDGAADGDDAVAAEPAAKRARTLGAAATLRASDVNVQRRDSTILLITGRPFYVVGPLIETKSSVLADALSSATTLDPVAIQLPNEVPEEQQYGLFHVAIEHAYTGTIASDVAAEFLLPLWCLGDHLQMDELCAWCAERLVPVLAKDAALLERAWTTALLRPSDALGDACATAWLLLELSITCTDDISSTLVLKGVHECCAVKELVAAQLARVMRKALLEKIAKDDAAAAAAAAAADADANDDDDE